MCGLISMQKGTPTLDLNSLQIMQHHHHTRACLLCDIHRHAFLKPACIFLFNPDLFDFNFYLYLWYLCFLNLP